jgi:transposase
MTLETLNELFNILKEGSKLQRRQAAALLLLTFGVKKTSIARACQSSTRTIANYQARFEREGVKSLHWRSAGRAKDESVQNSVIALLHTPPSSHGLNRTSWTLTDLNRTLRKQGSPVSEKVISEIIRLSGYRWLKAKKVLTSNDPNYGNKLIEIQAVLSNLGPNERFFSIDEMGPISIKKLGGKRLVPPGVIPQYPQYQRSKGRLIITAALELSTNQVTHFYSENKNTAEMLKLLNILLEQYATCDCLYLSWDAASWHASKELYKRVEEINLSHGFNDKRIPLVKLVPLPTCAQFLNVIESVFSGLARAVIHNSDYQSVIDAQTAIDKYFKERNNYFIMNPKKAGNRIWGRELVTPKFSVCQNCKDPRW